MPSPAGREGGRSRARPSRVPIIPVRTEAQRNPADKHGEAGPSASHSTPKRRAQPHSRVRPTGPAEPSRQAGLRGRAGEPSASHSQPRGRAQPQGETNRPSRAQPRSRARQGRAWRSGRDPHTQYPNRTSPQNRRVSDGRFDRSCREVRRSGVHAANSDAAMSLAAAVYPPACFFDDHPLALFLLLVLCWAGGVASGALCCNRWPLDLICNLRDC